MPVAVRRPSGPRGTPGLALLLALSMVCGVLVVVTSGTAGAEPAESTSAPAPVADLVPAGPVEVTGILSSIERDVGASAPLHDGNRIWAFGDSYGGGFHTSTAAFTTAQAPHTLVEHLDANAERAPFVPQDAGEAAFNRGLRFHPLAPARLADTRDASGALWPAGRAPGPLGGGETLWLDLDAHPALAGLVGGGAAVLNLTGVNTTEGSVATHLAVGPLFVPFTTSTLNLAPGEVAANLTTVGLGLGGINGIRNHTGTTHVVVDLLGFADAAHTVPGAPSPGQAFVPVPPTRVLDTGHGPGRLTAGTPRVVDTTGVAPPGAQAVLVNLTADAPSAATHLTAWAAGAPQPGTSNLNLPASTTRANNAVVPLDASGRLQVATNSGTTRAIVDVLGWYGPASGGELIPATPLRVLDTRQTGPPVAQTPRVVTLPRARVPVGARAAVLNVTAVSPTAATHLTLWAAGSPLPGTSNLNLPAGATRPAHAVVPLDELGRLAVRSNSGSVHVVVDLLGFVAGEATVVDPCPARPASAPRPYVAHWPQSIVAVPRGGGHDEVHVWFATVVVCTSIDYVPRDVGVATYDYRPQLAPPGSEPVVATRRNDHLFTLDEPYRYGRGGIVDGGRVHVFGCDPTNELACRRTSAALGDALAQRASYVDDPTDLDLPPNLATLNPPANLSVEWVEGLGRYLMLYTPPPWPDATALLRTATDLGGPWSEPVTLVLPGCGGPGNGCYTPRVRPDLSDASTLVFTYFDQSVTSDPIFDGRLLIARLPITAPP